MAKKQKENIATIVQPIIDQDEIVLGFDVSSSTIGYGVISINKFKSTYKFIHCGYIKPVKKFKSDIENLSATKDLIIGVITKYNPNYIGIEELIQYMSGQSNAKTIIKLAQYNSMVALASYEVTKLVPHYCHVLSIRAALKSANCPKPKKEDMPYLTSNDLGITFNWIYKPKVKTISEISYDIGDGLAVTLYYSKLLLGLLKKKKAKKSK